MHKNNIHIASYDLKKLAIATPQLKKYIKNINGSETLDFSDYRAVFYLNKALLYVHYNIKDWYLPQGYLCPPIPGRADYIHHLQDAHNKASKVQILDVGTGANAIYPLLGAAIYNWKMVGCDSNKASVEIARQNTSSFKDKIEIRLQENNSNILKGIIDKDDYFDYTMCNPPFYVSEKEALKANSFKRSNLKIKSTTRNFGGFSNELYCNGGEALFIKRMIKESVYFSDQVGWFTCLVSRKHHLPALLKLLDKLKATHRITPMEQGNKKSRFIAWKFTP